MFAVVLNPEFPGRTPPARTASEGRYEGAGHLQLLVVADDGWRQRPTRPHRPAAGPGDPRGPQPAGDQSRHQGPGRSPGPWCRDRPAGSSSSSSRHTVGGGANGHCPASGDPGCRCRRECGEYLTAGGQPRRQFDQDPARSRPRAQLAEVERAASIGGTEAVCDSSSSTSASPEASATQTTTASAWSSSGGGWQL